METERREQLLQQVQILEALAQAIDKRGEVFDAIEASETHEEALTAVGQILGIGEIRSRAVLDMQARRWTQGEARKIAAQIAVRRSELESL